MTFDDGLDSFYKIVQPIFEEFKIRATLFIPVNFISKEPTWQKANFSNADLEERVMTWSQLKELSSFGHEIASHGLTHNFLTKMPESQLLEEIIRSREILEEKLAIEVVSFSYPYGDYNEKVRENVKKAGYHWACTSDWGVWQDSKSPLLLKRVNINYNTNQDKLKFRCSSWYDLEHRVKRCFSKYYI